MNTKRWISLVSTILAVADSSGVFAQKASAPDLSSLNLEQLTRIEVSTALRREQALFETPAAVYVITHEELMRSGATSVPEALRMVPGVEVAQIDANKWAVSARGFNSRFANKMLIMIDGRSIYNPVYSGTLWDQNDLLLEDIDRIEIVRGPGATMWGANAVNGVINVVTSRPRDTGGVLLAGRAGNIDEVASARLGSATRSTVKSRVFAKYVRRGDLLTVDNGSARDGGTSERGGARLDWQPSNRDQLTFQGNLFRNPETQRIDFGYNPVEFLYSSIYGAGGFAMGKWERKLAGSDLALQSYFSNEHRNEIGMKVDMKVADIDFQHHINTGSRNDIVWGSSFRWTSDRISGSQSYFAHADHLVSLFSAFIQDSVVISPAKLTLTAGSKLQWNTYTKFEWQPRVSLIWTPDSAQAVWGAVSRAVRTPSDQDRDVRFLYPMGTSEGTPLFGLICGNPDLKAEIVIAHELGYRRRIAKWFSADVAGFVNRYADLQATHIGEPFLITSPELGIVQPFKYVNGFTAQTQGVEVSLGWTPAKSIRVLGSYAWMQARLRNHGDVTVQPSGGQDWSTPRNTFDVRAHWNMSRSSGIDAIVNGNSTVPSSLGIPVAIVSGHTRMDFRVTHALTEGLELAAGGTNLLSARHQEFYPEDYTLNSYVPRGIYLALNWAR